MVVVEEDWPWFKNPEAFSELYEIANDSFNLKNLQGYLSAVLIYQQLVEEMTWVLLKDCQFLTKIALWGRAEINFKEQKGVMFGRLIEELKKTIEFEGKHNFIAQCNLLNKIRIEIVHGLVMNGIHNNIEIKVKDAQNHFKDIYSTFKIAHEEFLGEFEKEKENVIFEHQAQYYD